MLKRLLILILITACALDLKAQSSTLSLYATPLKPANLAKFNIPPGNYSGITPLGNNLYAVVTDKAQTNGFYIFEILISEKGKITSVHNLGFRADSIHTAPRDMEGIIYHPTRKTLFISAESDQQILEYTLDGQLTGNRLNIPEQFSIQNIQPNYGFEALAYSPTTHLFWTTTENTLRSDLPSNLPNPPNLPPPSTLSSPFGGWGAPPSTLRLQSFTEDLQPSHQYIYQTDAPTKLNKKHKHYAFGVPAITALPDSTLLIIERELYVSKNYLSSSVTTKIYRINPTHDSKQKTLITKFRTPLHKLSNYEGMCLGPILPDGTQTILLICDSQNRYGNSFYHLKDRLRLILLSN